MNPLFTFTVILLGSLAICLSILLTSLVKWKDEIINELKRLNCPVLEKSNVDDFKREMLQKEVEVKLEAIKKWDGKIPDSAKVEIRL